MAAMSKALRPAIAVFLFGAAVRAEPTAEDRALAQSLFKQGRNLMDDKRWEEACPKLAESQRLDPAGGTLVNLALCFEGWGKTATAWSTFEEARSQARKDERKDREKFAGAHVAALEPRLAYLTVQLPAGAPVSGLEILLDGRALGRAAAGTPIAVDPGKHAIEVAAPGKLAWRTETEITKDGEKRSVEVPALADAPEERPAVERLPASTAAPPSTQPPAPPSDAAAGGGRTLGWIAGGIGVVGLAAGSYFGLRALASWDRRNAHCPSGLCDEEAVSQASDTDRSALLADVGFGVGIVGVGLGTYLLLKAPATTERGQRGAKFDPVLGRGVAGVRWSSAW